MSGAAINEMLSYALDVGASDLHLSVGSVPMVRIHGDMKKLQLPILDLDGMIAIKNEILNENQKKLFNERLEIDHRNDQSYMEFMEGGFKNSLLFGVIERFPCVALRSKQTYNFIELDNFSQTYDMTRNPFDREPLTSFNVYLVEKGATAYEFKLTCQNPVSVLALQKHLEHKSQ